MSSSSLDYPEMKEMFTRNAAWSKGIWKRDPGFFPKHYPGQRPEILWIGFPPRPAFGVLLVFDRAHLSDHGPISCQARTPECQKQPSWAVNQETSSYTGMSPSEVHHPASSDVHLSSARRTINAVMMIALQNFKVKHIVVTGHSNCVGCNSALNMSRLPPVPATTPLQRFLGHTATLARTLATESGPPSLDLLIEENVAQQVRNLLESDIIKQDWKRRGPDGVTIHGWVYQLEDGTIRDVNVSQGPPGQVIGKKADVW
ncbi:carbonic anhydrase [Dioszegia hungarica]|uniref:Carbonic anhydrase n=1 Tax=Dioszegia hungarica TaxID=4972 RepID=A0AA38H9I1_9TREE|nr:carbonic anhydrase [Dioszegia hungarica]KAI9635344.1 carbonic anhydrase [Dioszegia hungarica]